MCGSVTRRSQFQPASPAKRGVEEYKFGFNFNSGRAHDLNSFKRGRGGVAEEKKDNVPLKSKKKSHEVPRTALEDSNDLI